MMFALTSLAAAAPAPGFTTPGGEAAHRATVEVSAMVDDDRTYAQARLLGATHVAGLGVDVELVGLAGTGASSWSEARAGTFRVGVRAHFGPEAARMALGVALRDGLSPEAPGFWVLRGAHARQGLLPSITFDLSAGPERAPFGVRFELGLTPTAYDVEGKFAGSGFSVAQVLPLGGPLALLLEAEALLDDTPLALRTGPRLTLGHVTVDAAVHVPILLMVEHPVFVPVLAVRGAW